MKWFRKTAPVALETQLATLEEIGVVRYPEVVEEDLLSFHTCAEMEARPYRLLAESMAFDLEREPWVPIAPSLWMCDFECIEGPGAYAAVVERLELMTGSAAGLEQIEDRVVLHEEGREDEASVWFQCAGETVSWDLEVHDDWLDPQVLRLYDRLLASRRSEIRLCANVSEDYGQASFLAALTPSHARRFGKLTGVRMATLA